MKKCNVFICYTHSHAICAHRYISTMHLPNCVFIAAGAGACAYFRKSNQKFTLLADYQSYLYSTSTLMRKSSRRSYQIVSIIEKFAQEHKLNFKDINIISVVSDMLIYYLSDHILNLETYHLLCKKYKLATFYIPSDTHQKWSFANFLKERKEKIHLVTYSVTVDIGDQTSVWWERLLRYQQVFKFYRRGIFNILRNRIMFGPKLNLPAESKKRVFMQTGGIISSYYYDLYELLKKNTQFYLLLYKLKIEQLVPLLQRNISFVSLDDYLKRVTIDPHSYINTLILEAENSSYVKRKISKILTAFSAQEIDEIVETSLKFAKSKIPAIKKNIAMYSELLDTYKPDLVITTHDPSFTATCLVLPAKIRKIPTLLLLHGLPVEHRSYTVHSDAIQVWGKKNREYYKDVIRHNNKKIFETGFTRFDKITLNESSIPTIDPEIPLKLGILLSVYHPFHSHTVKYMYELFEELGKKSINIKIHLRFHEGFETAELLNLAKTFSIEAVDCSQDSLDDFVVDNDFFIIWDTTALLWLLIYNKPFIHTTSNWGAPIVPTQKYHIGLRTKSAEDAVRCIQDFHALKLRKTYSASDRRKFLNDFIGPVDGRATIRLNAYIQKILLKTTVD